MSLIDYIKQILNLNKQNAQIYSQTLQKTYGEKQPLEIGLYDGKQPITDTNITIIINNIPYTRKTDKDGIARLNINLNHGSYTATIEFENEKYNKVRTTCDVIVKPVQTPTRMEGIDLTKNYGDSTPYQCAVYNQDNNRIRESVNITVNGVKYTKQADNEGLYKLNINLNEGTYPIKAEYTGNEFYKPSYVNNTIVIKPKPVDPPVNREPQKSRYVKILEEFEKYFGQTEYIDDALEKIQGRGYSFYFSDGFNMYETIRRVYNGEGANCYDIAEVLYYIAYGMNEKYGRTYEVQYLDVWCPVSGYDHIRNRIRTSPNSAWFYRDGASVLSGNDITSNWCGTSENILEVNPSFIFDE